MPRLNLAALVLITILSTSRADDDLNVLTERAGDPSPGKRLSSYLEAQAKTHFDARRKAVAALKTPADVSGRQKTVKAAFREALGDLPSEKTPLNGRVVGRKQRDGYAVENVIYESRPGHHVTANFYLPDGKPPFPGVLVPCGHSANGKAAETYQRVCILLAKNGLAALCFDPIGQGERVQWLDDKGKPVIKGSTTEHTLLGLGALLVGRSAAGYRVWDGIRSLDYLASRPEIDPSRVGCTGNSGGGTETAYLMALDDRVLAAAPSCYITSLERLFATIGPQDAEQNVTGQVALGIEHADYITMRAPKPTLISVGTQDFFDIRGSWDTFQEVKRIYCTLRRGERVDLFESNEPHGFTAPRRESAMRWMRRWLLDKDDAPSETDSPIATDKDLQCTETGQVLSALHGKSAFDLNADRAAELDRMRVDHFAGRSPEALRAEVRKRIALAPSLGQVIVGRRPAVERDGYTINRWSVGTEPGVQVPVLLARADQPAKGPLVIYVGADSELFAPGGAIEARVKAGESVALVEPRGTGETSPSPNRPGAFGADHREAFLALHLNRPLLGQRVFDVLAALKALAPTEGPAEFRLVGVGDGGPIALHAAAIDERVTSVTVQRSILSWSAVARTPSARGNLAGAIPGVLESYDLPELASA
ncbi:MAG: acetylxylan esterase, partial [Planctomycetia bacterium]|nr:acetylxylan esterase [Planctomycetia bacterium]